MYKIFKTLIYFIWLIDIFNINYTINGVNVAYFLDATLPLNVSFWFIFLLIIPNSEDKREDFSLIKNLFKGDK